MHCRAWNPPLLRLGLRVDMKPCLVLCLLAAPALVTAAEKELLDALPQNAIQAAVQVLRRDYIRREDLTFEELTRAALQGLLERLDFGAEIITTDGPARIPTASVHAEFLAPGAAYLRPETFVEGEGALFERA